MDTKHIMEKYKQKSALDLEFEKVYISLILPQQRHASVGAKKRYAGLLVKDGKETMDVVGLEIVRRDWTELAKNFQRELLTKVFHKEKVEEFIQQFKDDLFCGKFDDLLVYRKAIRKPIEEYIKTTPPHIKAARKLDNLESHIIEYLITLKGPEPIQKIENKIDYEHYLEKQIKPIAQSILILFDKSFDEIVSGQTQSSLNEF